MMKIVLLTNILTPYRKVFYDRLYLAFREQGAEFKVLVMAETEPDRNWHYGEYQGEYTELLQTRTVRAGHIFFHFNKNLKRRLKEIRPDILVASGSYISPSIFRAIRLRKKLQYRLLFWSESHCSEIRSYHRFKLWLRERIRKYIYGQFDAFWYAGEKSLELIRSYDGSTRGDKNPQYYFVPNLVDPDFYRKASETEEAVKRQLRMEYGIPGDNFIFVLPARLTGAKGILPFIRLFDKSEYKDLVTVLILGEGELRSEILRTTEQLRLDIRLPGYKKQEEILNYYSVADGFLLPSLSDANPLSCIEALWAGLPLFVSEHVGNYPETIVQGRNGYVFRYEEPEEAIGMLNRLITSKEDWRLEARSISLQIARRRYEPEGAVKLLVDRMLEDMDLLT